MNDSIVNIDITVDSYSKESIIKIISATLVPICELLVESDVIDRQNLANIFFNNSQKEPDADWSHLVNAISQVIDRSDNSSILVSFEANPLKRITPIAFSLDHCNSN